MTTTTTTAIRATFKGHGRPETFVYFGRATKADPVGVPARAEIKDGLLLISHEDGQKIESLGTATAFWAAPVAADEAPKATKAVAAAEPKKATVTAKADEPKAEAKKAAPAKKAAAPVEKKAVKPTTVKEMTREQKRAVAALLIEAAGKLVDRTDFEAATGDMEGVSAKVAGELIGSWLSYCPGTEWHAALGARPRGGSAK